MGTRPRPTPAERFRTVLALHETAEEMVRQKARRRKHDALPEEIERAVQDWRERRPGAEHGDCPGRPVGWPRPV